MKKRLIRKKQLNEKVGSINKGELVDISNTSWADYKITYITHEEINKKFMQGMCINCLALAYGITSEDVQSALRKAKV